MLRFVLLAVVSLLIVALAFCVIGCLPADARMTYGVQNRYWAMRHGPQPSVPVTSVTPGDVL